MKKFLLITLLTLALTLTSFACESSGEYLTFKGYITNDGQSITALIYQDLNGQIEVFNWYDEMDQVDRYKGSILYYDREMDYIAVYESAGNFEWRILYSDWD